jgi:hypothetical protein
MSTEQKNKEETKKKTFLRLMDNIDREKIEYIRLATHKSIEENRKICINEFMKKCIILNSSEKLVLIHESISNDLKNEIGKKVFVPFLTNALNRNTFLLANTLINLSIHPFETPFNSALKAIEKFKSKELEISDENEIIAFLIWRHFLEVYEAEFNENPCLLVNPYWIERSKNNTLKQIKEKSDKSIKL